MKEKELIERLENMNPEAEIRVSAHIKPIPLLWSNGSGF